MFNADKVTTLPWWASEPAFVPLYPTDDSAGCRYSVSAIDLSTPIVDDARAPTMSSARSTHRAAPSPVGDSTSLDISNATNSTLSSSSLVKLIEEDPPISIDTQPVEESSGLHIQNRSTRQSLLRRMSLPSISLHKQNRIAPKTRLRVEPKSHFANICVVIVFHGTLPCVHFIPIIILTLLLLSVILSPISPRSERSFNGLVPHYSLSPSPSFCTFWRLKTM